MRFALMLPLLFHRFALEDPNFVLYLQCKALLQQLTALTVQFLFHRNPSFSDSLTLYRVLGAP